MARMILVVDDEPDAQKLLELILSRAGFQVTTATNGPEALAWLKRALPDLIILDVMMPDMDGYEVLRRLRADPRTRGIPVIMLSAKGDVRDRVTGLRLGADDYVPKPADPSELVARVEAILARAQRGGPVSRGRALAFMGAKGGVGTTTVALNVAAALAQRYQVILAELRRGMGTAANYLGLHPTHTLADLMREGEALQGGSVRAALLSHACGLRLLSAPQGVPELPSCEPAFVEALFDHLVQAAEFLVLDLAGDATFVHPILSKVETLIILTSADPVSIQATRVALALAADHGLGGERSRVVLVNQAPGTGIGITELAEVLKHPVQATIPYAREACAAAARSGRPVVLSRANELIGMTFLGLAGQLTGTEVGEMGKMQVLPSKESPGVQQPLSETSRSLFSRIRRPEV